MNTPSLVEQVTSIVEQRMRSSDAFGSSPTIESLVDPAAWSQASGPSERCAAELAAANTLALLAIARYLDEHRHALASELGGPLIPSGLG